jgi:hypothetical protein
MNENANIMFKFLIYNLLDSIGRGALYSLILLSSDSFGLDVVGFFL